MKGLPSNAVFHPTIQTAGLHTEIFCKTMGETGLWKQRQTTPEFNIKHKSGFSLAKPSTDKTRRWGCLLRAFVE